MARRILETINQDAAVNAVVVLDYFAKNWAFSKHDQLAAFKKLFTSYLRDEQLSHGRPLEEPLDV